MKKLPTQLCSVELCAGGGGQALGLEQAGFSCLELIEIDKHAVATLKQNRPNWRILTDDIKNFSAVKYKGVDLLAAGLPCPPFSQAGKQLGRNDERDLFPVALDLISQCLPRAVMIENVPRLLDRKFAEYYFSLEETFRRLGYTIAAKVCNATWFCVPQSRSRAIMIAFKQEENIDFCWPKASAVRSPTVGEALYDLMASKGWKGAANWKAKANSPAPTIVGGSKKHGGADLGPTGAKRAWSKLGVDGHSIADAPPGPEFPFGSDKWQDNQPKPKLTLRMVARLQGFPDDWRFCGRKTSVYRQIGNALPSPMAQAVGREIHRSLSESCSL